MAEKDDEPDRVMQLRVGALFSGAMDVAHRAGMPETAIASALTTMLATLALAMVDYDEAKAKEVLATACDAAIEQSLSTLAEARDEFVKSGHTPPPGVDAAVARYRAKKDRKGKFDA